MKKILAPMPISILVLVTCLMIVGIIFSGNFQLTDNEKIQDSLAVFTVSCGIISVVFVLLTYIQSSKAFINSQKPSLLVQVENVQAENLHSNKQEVLTRIHYRNTTNNTFEDLTFIIDVSTQSKQINISDLFRKSMNIPGSDSRKRTFDIVSVLTGKGFDLMQESSHGNEIRLKIRYTFTFLGNKESVLAQEYKWDSAEKGWTIF